MAHIQPYLFFTTGSTFDIRSYSQRFIVNIDDKSDNCVVKVVVGGFCSWLYMAV